MELGSRTLKKAMAVHTFNAGPEADMLGVKRELDSLTDLTPRTPYCWGPNGVYSGNLTVTPAGALVTGFDTHIAPGRGGHVEDTRLLAKIVHILEAYGYMED